MLAAALAAVMLAANTPVHASNDPLAPPDRSTATALCIEIEAPRKPSQTCIRNLMRDDAARRAFGPAYGWARTLIDRTGWTLRAADADKVELTRDGGDTSEGPRAWQRSEKREESGPTPHLSGVWLYQFDCPGQRMKTLQSTLYAGHNLQGASQTVTIEMPKWEYANPGSIAEVLMRESCPPAKTVSAVQPLTDPNAR